MTLERRRDRAIVLSVALFTALVATAMALYPGGHSWDSRAQGHDLWRNYLCDLARGIALDGQPNPGALAGKLAMIVLAAGLVPFFARTTSLAPRAARLGRAVRTLASVTAMAVFLVAFVSGDRYGRLHAAAVVLAGVPGLAAGAGAVLALAWDRRSPRDVLGAGALTLGLGLVDFTLYVANVGADGGGPVAVTVLQRLATVALLAWMLAAARRRPADATQHAGSEPRGVTRGSRPPVALEAEEKAA